MREERELGNPIKQALRRRRRVRRRRIRGPLMSLTTSLPFAFAGVTRTVGLMRHTQQPADNDPERSWNGAVLHPDRSRNVAAQQPNSSRTVAAPDSIDRAMPTS